MQSLVRQLRGLILGVFPQALEQVDPPSKIIAYGFYRTYEGLVCAIAPQRGYVNLMFSQGAQLDDPSHLLEGTGKRARHVKIRGLSDIEKPEVRAILQEAVSRSGM
jgi:hypothetical protein